MNPRRASLRVIGKDRPHLRLRASNGETLGHSETYTTRSGAVRGRVAWLDALADVILTDPDAFFAAHPDVVTAAHAYSERARQDGAS